VSSYPDLTTADGMRRTTFNNLRRYSASILVFPFKTIAQPYVGVGFGLMQTVAEYPDGPFGTALEEATVKEEANRAGSYTFAMFTGGVQVRVANFAVFGQYQITTSPEFGSLLIGPTHTFTAGLRVSLGSAREGDATSVAD
jgi:hypothetical protein